MSMRRHAVSFLVPYLLVPLVLAPIGACEEAAPFTENYWQLTTLLGEVVPAHELRYEPHLVFHGEGNAVVGNGGCNWIAGTWDRQDSALEFLGLGWAAPKA